MMDLLVSIAVISVLIALLLPAVSKVRESTRKVICGSNMRQLGMGVSIFSQDNGDKLPNSVFLPPPRSNASSYPSPERMDTVRLSRSEFQFSQEKLWDGLGILFGREYITAPNVYYCPSHKGNFVFDDVASQWAQLDGLEEIISNYHYRGTGPTGSRVLYNIDPGAALVTDSLRSYEDLNHQGGFNILQAGLAVNWHNDIGGQIAQDILLRTTDDTTDSFVDAWGRLDGLPDEDSGFDP